MYTDLGWPGDTWVFRRWSTRSWAVPFHTVHHVTGHRQSCASSIWNKAMCLPKFCWMYFPQWVQLPDCVQLKRSLHSFLIRSRSCWYLDMKTNRGFGQLWRRQLSSLNATNGKSSSSTSWRSTSWNQMLTWSSGATNRIHRLSGTDITFTIAALARNPIMSGISGAKSYSWSDAKSNYMRKNVPASGTEEAEEGPACSMADDASDDRNRATTKQQKSTIHARIPGRIRHCPSRQNTTVCVQRKIHLS